MGCKCFSLLDLACVLFLQICVWAWTCVWCAYVCFCVCVYDVYSKNCLFLFIYIWVLILTNYRDNDEGLVFKLSREVCSSTRKTELLKNHSLVWFELKIFQIVFFNLGYQTANYISLIYMKVCLTEFSNK